jgi:acyl dehydratase
MTTMESIRFDDIAALDALVSEDFGPWGVPLTVPQEMIAAFAEMTGDRQWIHVDAARAAAESPFGATIAHGFLMLSLSPLLRSGGGVPIVGHRDALNYGLDRVRFIAPVPAGSTIHGRSRIIGAAREKGGTMLTTGVAIHVVDAERPAVCFDWKVLYRG